MVDFFAVTVLCGDDDFLSNLLSEAYKLGMFDDDDDEFTFIRVVAAETEFLLEPWNITGKDLSDPVTRTMYQNVIQVLLFRLRA